VQPCQPPGATTSARVRHQAMPATRRHLPSNSCRHSRRACVREVVMTTFDEQDVG
jgi:hypothetical protein